jgi:prepilin-type N-terminal cleavage/methylation domain-containing protein
VKIKKQNKQKGFSLMELVVGVAIFAILATGLLTSFSVLSRSVRAARIQTAIATIASNELEILHNLPYSQIGTVNGNPNGSLPDQNNPQTVVFDSRNYKVYYEVTYIDDPADGTILAGTDAAPDDYKQVKMKVVTPDNQITAFVTTIAPKGLEGLVSAGAILVNVIDANGNPVSGASVHIENLAANPDIILDRTSDSAGKWAEVGLPEASGAAGKLPANSYHIVVTKNGYSTDQTYPISVQNPNPVKPDATVLNGQVTSLTFQIDLLANLTIKTLDQYCQPLSGVGVNVKGTKLIGLNPNILKFDYNANSINGLINWVNIEWDTYIPTLYQANQYTLYGTSPIQQIQVLPGSNQTFTMILGPYSTNSFLVIVKDAATGAALEGVTVHLRKGGSVPQDYYASTGGSVWVQSDWRGGSGQSSWSSVDRYNVDDGNIDNTNGSNGLLLKKTSGNYSSSGWLESSTFDTGGSSDFTTISWQPQSQVLGSTIQFQLAANNDNATWNYVGPDGTASTYYTIAGTSISSALDGKRYIRYKAYLSTTDSKQTPNLSSVSINYVSGCYTPGQVVFVSLTSGNNYDLDLTLNGYQTVTLNNLTINGNAVLQVLMNH